MISLGCALGRMGDFPLPVFLQNNAPSIRAFFWEGSNHDIDLRIDGSGLGRALQPGPAAYTALDLQIHTLNLTQNPPPPHKSERIAVLFANYYRANLGVLGVMFDRGRPSSWDDPNPPAIARASPREGCAVFLGAIASLRGQGLAFQIQAQFTTVHEMGHIFNLQHADVPLYPPNFLATTQSNAPYAPGGFQFLPDHKLHLAACSTSPAVWPGGYPFDGDSGDLPATGPDRRWPAGPVEPFGLQMAVRMSQAEFWMFEPVELEIELSVAPGVVRRFSIPDTVDPGYDSFVIWLEDPTGERRRYRSPRRYCSVPGRRTVAPGRPFRRDVSIFLESGGYTFRRSGVWRIWAEFRFNRAERLLAAPVEVFVRPRNASEAYRRAAERLAHPRSAALLYHRLVRRDVSDGDEALLAEANDAGSPLRAGGIEYALGRALAETAREAGDETKQAAAAELLRRARDREDLGEHRRAIADRVIAGRPLHPKSRRKAAEIPEPPECFEPYFPELTREFPE